jgi:demethylmacrocin O-methyltransferase
MTQTLQELGVLYGSDKFTRHDYAPVYARYLEPRRYEPLKLLEIGIGGEDYELGGPSLFTWRDYLPNAQIYAIDIYDKSALNGDRIKTFNCSQADQAGLAALNQEYGPFDIVVDDGDHKANDTLAALFCLFPLLAPNGLYFIEDIQTSYWAQYGGSSLTPDCTDTPTRWLKLAVDIVNRGEILNDDNYPVSAGFEISSLHVHHNLAVLQKNAIGESMASNVLTAEMKREFLAVDEAMHGARAALYRKFTADPGLYARALDAINRAGGIEQLDYLVDFNRKLQQSRIFKKVMQLRRFQQKLQSLISRNS